MANREQQFKYSVHKYLPSELTVEGMNNPFRRGTPDNWYSGDKADLWVEWKFVSKLPKKRLNVERLLSPMQRQWLLREYEHGRNVAVIVGSAEGGLVFPDDTWLVPATAFNWMKRADIAKWIIKQTM